MAQTEQEKQDLVTLLEETKKLKISAYDYCVHLLSIKPEELAYTGHKNVLDALFYTMSSAQRSIERLVKKHIKKYPDVGLRGAR